MDLKRFERPLFQKAGELLPINMVLLCTEIRFVINYSTHEKASNTDQFIAHLTQASST